MVAPIDYSGAFASQTPTQAIAQGFQLGAGIRDDQQQQAALQAQQQAAQQQQQALRGLLTNPRASADDYAAATLLFPGLKDQVKQAWDMKNTAQQESMARDNGQVFAALQSNKPEVAIQFLQRRADAMEGAGADPREIQQLRTQAQIIEADPAYARSSIGMFLSGTEAGRKVLTAAAGMGQEQRAAEKAPAELAKLNAEAGIATVEAENAPTKTNLANVNAAEDIETKRANREIAALDTQIKQANSETQRGELILKRDAAQAALDAKKLEKAEGAQSKLDKIDLSLNTVNAIFNHPGMKSVLGFGGVGSLTGKLSGHIPGSDRKDLQGLVDTLQAQQFLTGVQNLVGMGALSDAEGKKIGSAVASLDLDQSAPAFKNAMGVIKTTLEKAQRNTLASGTAPTQGGGFVLKHPQFGNVTEGDINRMMANNPGSTRDQVLQYLNSTGGRAPSGGGATGSY